MSGSPTSEGQRRAVDLAGRRLAIPRNHSRIRANPRQEASLPTRHIRCLLVEGRKAHMDKTKESVQEGFDRLQRLLFDMLPGDEFRPKDAARICGLSQNVCRTVFEG